MPSVWTDFAVLGITIAAGLGIGLLHDFWLILVLGRAPGQGGRGQAAPVPSSRLWGFWLLSLALAWAVLARYASGQVRGFVFLGFAAGAGLYYLAFSPLMRRAIGTFRRLCAGAARVLLDGLSWLVLLPWRVLCWIGSPVIALVTVLLRTPAGWLLNGIEFLIRQAGHLAQWARGISLRRRLPPHEP